MNSVEVEHEGLWELFPPAREWTVDDLDRFPNDGRRYELFDGVLVVSPAPRPRHQRTVGGMYALLGRTCPNDLEVFFAPFDFQPTHKRSFQPDLLVVRRADVNEDGALHEPPVLTVEVLSDSTRSLDQDFKRKMYATSAVDNYWIFDPKALEFVAYERTRDDYREVARASGDQRISLERPFPVEICPAEIVKGWQAGGPAGQ